MLRTKLALGVLALSAGVYSTYYVIKDEQINEEDVVDVVENIEPLKALEEAQEIPLLTSLISETSSDVDVIDAKSGGESDHLVTNDSITPTSDDTEEVIVNLASVSDDQTDSVLTETKEPKDSVSETTSKPDASMSEPSSDLEPISGEVKSGESESLNPPPETTDKKEEEVNLETSSNSTNTKPKTVNNESSSLNTESEFKNGAKEVIVSQSSHSGGAAVLDMRTLRGQDLRVDQVQDFEVEVIGADEIDFEEGGDIIEAFRNINLDNLASWGSNDASFIQDLSIEKDSH